LVLAYPSMSARAIKSCTELDLDSLITKFCPFVKNKDIF